MSDTVKAILYGLCILIVVGVVFTLIHVALCSPQKLGLSNMGWFKSATGSESALGPMFQKWSARVRDGMRSKQGYKKELVNFPREAIGAPGDQSELPVLPHGGVSYMKAGIGAEPVPGVQNMKLNDAYDTPVNIVNDDVPVTEEITDLISQVQKGTGPLPYDAMTVDHWDSDEPDLVIPGGVLSNVTPKNPNATIKSAYGVKQLESVEVSENVEDTRQGVGTYGVDPLVKNSMFLPDAYPGSDLNKFDDPAFDGDALMNAQIFKTPIEQEQDKYSSNLKYEDLLRGPPRPFDVDRDGFIDEQNTDANFPAQLVPS